MVRGLRFANTLPSNPLPGYWVFAENCRYTAAFIARLDAALPAALRTPPGALEWLESA